MGLRSAHRVIEIIGLDDVARDNTVFATLPTCILPETNTLISQDARRNIPTLLDVIQCPGRSCFRSVLPL
jgi:hypothetical protein